MRGGFRGYRFGKEVGGGNPGCLRLNGDECETCGCRKGHRVDGRVSRDEFKLVFKVNSIHAGMRTGSDSIPRTKLEYTRFGSPTTSIRSNRFSISCQTIFNCSSASRMPTQR
jgi:hypothetical protein